MNHVIKYSFVLLIYVFLFVSKNQYFSVSSIPLLLFIFLCFKDWRWVQEKIVKYRLECGLIGIAFLFGIIFSVVPEKSVKGAYDFFRGAILFFPAMYLVENYFHRFFKTLPWAVFLGVVYLWTGALLLLNGLFVQKNHINQTFSLIVDHYNIYGTLAATVCLVGLIGLLYQENRDKISSSLIGISILASLFLTVYSGSRGSVVALVPAVFFLLLNRYPRWRWAVVYAGLFCISALLLAVYFGTLGNLIMSWQRGADWTSGRLETWHTIISRVYENVPLTGYGPNTFKYLQYGQIDNPQGLSPHNVYIESFYSFGFIGSCLLLVALLMLLFKEKSHHEPGVFLLLGIAITILYLLRGLVDMGLCNVMYVGHVALALGFIHGRGHEKVQIVHSD